MVRRPKPGSVEHEKALALAEYRLLGMDLEQAGEKAGYSRSAAWRRENSSWWPDMLAEAGKTRLGGRARRMAWVAVYDLLKQRDGPTVRFVLERLEPQFLPPAQRVELPIAPAEEAEIETLQDAERYLELVLRPRSKR